MAILRTVKKAEGIKPIPADIYPAQLVGLTQDSGNYGDYFILEFGISSGSYEGEKRTIVASDKLSRGTKGSSKLLKILETLEGQKIDFDQEIDIESFLGKECRIVVKEATEKDGITIQNISEVMPPQK